ncbi:MAG: NTP transferase domain-containing protein [Haloquadratum sp.]
MCGGRGTRLRGEADGDAGVRDDLDGGREVEKPLVEVCGDPMLDRVVAALDAGRLGEGSTVYAAVSPHAPATADRARDLPVSVVETGGDGYVADLTAALDAIGRPALTVPADLPLLSSEHVEYAVERAGVEAPGSSGNTEPDAGPTPTAAPDVGVDERATSLTVCVPAALKRRLGASVDTTFERDGRTIAPTGLNVVAGDGDTVVLTYDARLAVNVNRPEDVAVAEALCTRS